MRAVEAGNEREADLVTKRAPFLSTVYVCMIHAQAIALPYLPRPILSTLYASSSPPTKTRVLAIAPLSTTSPIFPLRTLNPRPSRLLLIDIVLGRINVLLQMLNLILPLADPALKLRLELVRGAFAGGDFLLVDDEGTAAMLVVVAIRVASLMLGAD